MERKQNLVIFLLITVQILVFLCLIGMKKLSDHQESLSKATKVLSLTLEAMQQESENQFQELQRYGAQSGESRDELLTLVRQNEEATRLQLHKEFSEKFENLHTALRDTEQRFSQYKETAHLISQEQKDSILDSENRLRKKIHEINNELFYLAEKMNFFIPQVRSQSTNFVLQAMKSGYPSPVGTNAFKLLELEKKELSEFEPPESLAYLYPPMEMLKDRGYKLLKHNKDLFFYKGKGIHEHLGYVLTQFFIEGQEQVPSMYLRDYPLGAEKLNGTIQKFIPGLQKLESPDLSNLGEKQVLDLFRYMLIDYMLGNSDRDFLFDPKTGVIFAVDTDDSFNYKDDFDFFSERSFFYELVQANNNSPSVRTFIPRLQFLIQSVSDQALEEVFQSVQKDDLWEAAVPPAEALQIMLERKRKLGEFVKKLLVHLTL